MVNMDPLALAVVARISVVTGNRVTKTLGLHFDWTRGMTQTLGFI